MSQSKISAATIVAMLDAKSIVDRLRELDREQAALRILLRAARARERSDKKGPASRQGNAQ